MAGPTPVSAMIHAATMVSAGVFLLGRTYPMMSPDALMVIAVVGAFTALFAATIGTTAYDLKAVLAWSTISQLGFMVAAVGLGAVAAGMFHMVTHAFCKGCLFLSAGSVILGCHHVQDMRVMGGIRKYMPITAACMIICTLAISGVPFFSGFYSKDMIIKAGVLGWGTGALWAKFSIVALALAAALTAFYMFRLVFMTFFGEYRGNKKEHMYSAALAAEGYEGPEPHHEHGDHGHDDHANVPHESPWVMTTALCILSFGAIFFGHFWLADPGHLIHPHHSEPWFVKMTTAGAHESSSPEAGMYPADIALWRNSLEPSNLLLLEEGQTPAQIVTVEPEADSAAHTWAVVWSLTVATLGILLAVFLYVFRRDLPAKIAGTLGPIYRTVRRKYYVDEIYDKTFIRWSFQLAALLRWIDEKIVDGLVNFVGYANKFGGDFAAWFDRIFVDGAVNAVALVSQGFGAAVRIFQTGRIQQYATFAMGGALLATGRPMADAVLLG